MRKFVFLGLLCLLISACSTDKENYTEEIMQYYILPCFKAGLRQQGIDLNSEEYMKQIELYLQTIQTDRETRRNIRETNARLKQNNLNFGERLVIYEDMLRLCKVNLNQ